MSKLNFTEKYRYRFETVSDKDKKALIEEVRQMAEDLESALPKEDELREELEEITLFINASRLVEPREAAGVRQRIRDMLSRLAKVADDAEEFVEGAEPFVQKFRGIIGRGIAGIHANEEGEVFDRSAEKKPTKKVVKKKKIKKKNLKKKKGKYEPTEDYLLRQLEALDVYERSGPSFEVSKNKEEEVKLEGGGEGSAVRLSPEDEIGHVPSTAYLNELVDLSDFEFLPVEEWDGDYEARVIKILSDIQKDELGHKIFVDRLVASVEEAAGSLVNSYAILGYDAENSAFLSKFRTEYENRVSFDLFKKMVENFGLPFLNEVLGSDPIETTYDTFGIVYGELNNELFKINSDNLYRRDRIFARFRYLLSKHTTLKDFANSLGYHEASLNMKHGRSILNKKLLTAAKKRYSIGLDEVGRETPFELVTKLPHHKAAQWISAAREEDGRALFHWFKNLIESRVGTNKGIQDLLGQLISNNRLTSGHIIKAAELGCFTSEDMEAEATLSRVRNKILEGFPEGEGSGDRGSAQLEEVDYVPSMPPNLFEVLNVINKVLQIRIIIAEHLKTIFAESTENYTEKIMRGILGFTNRKATESFFRGDRKMTAEDFQRIATLFKIPIESLLSDAVEWDNNLLKFTIPRGDEDQMIKDILSLIYSFDEAKNLLIESYFNLVRSKGVAQHKIIGCSKKQGTHLSSGKRTLSVDNIKTISEAFERSPIEILKFSGIDIELGQNEVVIQLPIAA